MPNIIKLTQGEPIPLPPAIPDGEKDIHPSRLAQFFRDYNNYTTRLHNYLRRLMSKFNSTNIINTIKQDSNWETLIQTFIDNSLSFGVDQLTFTAYVKVETGTAGVNDTVLSGTDWRGRQIDYRYAFTEDTAANIDTTDWDILGASSFGSLFVPYNYAGSDKILLNVGSDTNHQIIVRLVADGTLRIDYANTTGSNELHLVLALRATTQFTAPSVTYT